MIFLALGVTAYCLFIWALMKNVENDDDQWPFA